jgi:MFS family permease
MGSLLSCVFFLAIAYNAYRAAKRAGRWSWPQFFVVVAALVGIPLLILQPLMHWSWLQDKPALFVLIYVGLIVVCVGALAYALNKYWPLPNRPLADKPLSDKKQPAKKQTAPSLPVNKSLPAKPKS